ncbi:hypothetical protein F5Y08DRAFT_332445 [Xylaria arbuscula]|nr:hypothetical protein F5Y08DRAFT_332445 [Xylaria arbuscula]
MSAFEGSEPLPLGTRRINNPWSPFDCKLLTLPPAKSYLDPDGDLCIQVGESPATSFVVCSRTLARSSSYWNAMLNGEFKESKKFCSESGSERTIKLHEDDPKPMALLLNIVHSRFDQVPSYESIIDIRYLYEISVLTDKYDMTHVLRPWARGWLRSTQHLSTWPGLSLREQYCHERLWISWELGDTTNFEKIANILLLNSSTSAEDANSLRCDGILEPLDIYEDLQRIRLDTIGALLTSLDNIIQGLMQKDEKFCQRSGQGDCLASMLGTGIQSLCELELYPIPHPVDVQWSVSDLSAKLKTVEIKGNFGEYHKCSQELALQAEVEKVLDFIPSLLTEVHHRHLNSQAKKSGV